jgi:hypothetical protein
MGIGVSMCVGVCACVGTAGLEEGEDGEQEGHMRASTRPPCPAHRLASSTAAKTRQGPADNLQQLQPAARLGVLATSRSFMRCLCVWPVLGCRGAPARRPAAKGGGVRVPQHASHQDRVVSPMGHCGPAPGVSRLPHGWVGLKGSLGLIKAGCRGWLGWHMGRSVAARVVAVLCCAVLCCAVLCCAVQSAVCQPAQKAEGGVLACSWSAPMPMHAKPTPHLQHSCRRLCGDVRCRRVAPAGSQTFGSRRARPFHAPGRSAAPLCSRATPLRQPSSQGAGGGVCGARGQRSPRGPGVWLEECAGSTGACSRGQRACGGFSGAGRAAAGG